MMEDERGEREGETNHKAKRKEGVEQLSKQDGIDARSKLMEREGRKESERQGWMCDMEGFQADRSDGEQKGNDLQEEIKGREEDMDGGKEAKDGGKKDKKKGRQDEGKEGIF